METKCNGLFGYLNMYAFEDFKSRGFSKEDAVIFGALSYLYFERIKINKPTLLKDLVKELKIINKGSIEQKRNPALFRKIIKTKRYEKVKVCFAKVIEDKDKNIQFGAVTFLLDNGLNVVAFRGTTLKSCGWIENLNMSVYRKTKCQEYGVKYLRKVSSKLEGNFIVLGHSKGGNTAIYASMNQQIKVKQRIEKIYDLDGPGFKDDIYKSKDFKDIENKTIKIITKNDIVGSLLCTYSKFIVVDCYMFSLFTHDLYNWKFECGKLKIIDKISNNAKKRNYYINKFINSLTIQEKKDIINFLNRLIIKNKALLKFIEYRQ